MQDPAKPRIDGLRCYTAFRLESSQRYLVELVLHYSSTRHITGSLTISTDGNKWQRPLLQKAASQLKLRLERAPCPTSHVQMIMDSAKPCNGARAPERSRLGTASAFKPGKVVNMLALANSGINVTLPCTDSHCPLLC